MKKIIIAMAAIAAAFTTASCNKELVNPNENPTVGKSVITASIENDATKTALTPDEEGYKVVWKEGDKIYVGDINEEMWSAEYTLDSSSADSSKGTFGWQDGDFFCPENDIYTKPTFEKGEEYEAIYPFSLFNMDDNGGYAGGNTWKTEQTYSTTDLYIPMYAKVECQKDEEVEFTFKNLGGLLRLTVKGTAVISSITIQANEKMSGYVCLVKDFEGNMVAEAVDQHPESRNEIILDCGKDGVELKSEKGTDFYISIPCRSIYDEEYKRRVLDGYSDVTITLTDMKDRTCVKKLSSDKKLFIERSKITTATFTASEFKANVPEGALPGKFSVSDNRVVYFSKGNLYCSGAKFNGSGTVQSLADATWGFETNQYDMTPSENGDRNISHISHFMWCNSAEEAMELRYGGLMWHASFFAEKEFLVGGVNNWSTLTIDEWRYLLKTRTMIYDAPRYTIKTSGITIGGINYCGLFIYPDDYDGKEVGDESETWTWRNINDAGIVFLPAAGYRGGFNGSTHIDDVGSCGYYWSASSLGNDDFAFGLNFGYSDIAPNASDDRGRARSVRLVTDVK